MLLDGEGNEDGGDIDLARRCTAVVAVRAPLRSALEPRDVRPV